MFKAIPGFSLYEIGEDKVIRNTKTKSTKSPHRGGSSIRLYTEDGKELSRKIDKLYDLTFPEKLSGVLLAPYSSYRVLETGEIYSIYEAKMLKPSTNKYGYLQVSLKNDNGGTASELVHRLVANAYLDPLEGKSDVNHKDGVKSNNNHINLEWCNKNENMQHAYDNSLKTPKKKKCSLTDAQGVVAEFSSGTEAALFVGACPGALRSAMCKNREGRVPTKGYGKLVGKYTCKGYIPEYTQ